MFEEVKAFLEGMSVTEKKQWIENIEKYQKHRRYLMAKGILEYNEKKKQIEIKQDSEYLDEFLDLNKKLGISEEQVVDLRK